MSICDEVLTFEKQREVKRRFERHRRSKEFANLVYDQLNIVITLCVGKAEPEVIEEQLNILSDLTGIPRHRES